MTEGTLRISGHIIDILNKQIIDGEVVVEGGRIVQITHKEGVQNQFILPGFIDAHVHIESSMLVPSEFARLAVVHGTVATVSDPHEIANVLGISGVNYMIANGSKVPFNFYFGAPSCVPATAFETAGAALGADAIDELLGRPEIRYLAEMMNWPGVINNEPLVHAKLNIARKHGKPVDGHAPGLDKSQAKLYIQAGITTDHECVTLEDAEYKLSLGMKVIIREGSAAMNFDALIGLLPNYADRVMFCSDDKHPDSLVEGHINLLVKRSLKNGIDLFSVLQVACLNPISHYGLDVGQLRTGDPADFIVVDDLDRFNVLQTYIRGQLVAENGSTRIQPVAADQPNNFTAFPIHAVDLQVKAGRGQLRVIEALDGQLITHELLVEPTIVDGHIVSDIKRDILKMVVVNRYTAAPPAMAFVRNFGLKEGAIASCVAHDSHNIIAIGTDDNSLAKAINAIIREKGGISAVTGGNEAILPLPVAGIMSTDDGYRVAHRYKEMDKMARKMGSSLRAPYMTLSFMALLVIPSIKLSDKGLFNGSAFEFIPLFK